MAFLEFGDVRQEARGHEREPVPSKLTGRDLRQFEMAFSVASATAAALRESLGEADEVVLVLDQERVPCERGNWNTAEAHGSGVAEFRVELTERETVEPEAVSLASMRLLPTRYAEDLNLDGKRTISITVVVSAEEEQALRVLLRDSDTIPVVRHGVSDAPLEMQAGAIVHSAEPDGLRKVRFHLFEPSDSRGPLALWAVIQGNVERELGAERHRTRLLVDTLVSKGVLTAEEAEAVGKPDDEAVADFLYSLSEVDDADDDWI